MLKLCHEKSIIYIKKISLLASASKVKFNNLIFKAQNLFNFEIFILSLMRVDLNEKKLGKKSIYILISKRFEMLVLFNLES